jgi:5-methylcytosine-specific restriction protein A
MKNKKANKRTVDQYKNALSRPAFLFAWNSNPDMFDNYEVYLRKLSKKGTCTVRWRCNSKTIRSGDRIFLIKIGKHPKGIIGSGKAITDPYDNGIDLELDMLLGPDDASLSIAVLQKGNLSKQNWTPQMNGISIKPEVVGELEEKWALFIKPRKTNHPLSAPLTAENYSGTYTEGETNLILQTRYERNPIARKACLHHYGYSCVVCDFNFQDTYGEIGKRFIHVHHLLPMATIGVEYKINAIKDLRPVCPNCHAMLHTHNPPLTIAKLKKLLQK